MTLAFVFGAGSSRGALQVGALEALLDAGIWPEMVVGSSIGALNAAFLAQRPEMGAVYRLQELYCQADFRDVFVHNELDVLKNVVTGENHIFPHQGLKTLLEEVVQFEQFGDLVLPCYVTATAMETGDLHVFGVDPADELLPSILSSAALIPLYPPVEVKGTLYADGGLQAALPLQVAVDQGATEIIALNLIAQLQPREERDSPVDLLLHSFDLLTQSQVALTRKIAEVTTAVPVHIIDLVPEDYTSFSDMEGMENLIDQGRRQARQAIRDLNLSERPASVATTHKE